MVNKLLHRISFLLLFVFTILVAQAGTAPMVLEYNTNLSEGTTIQIPLIGTDLIFDWGDGNKDTIPSCVDYVSHTYATHGIYTISFTGVVTSYGNWHNNQGIEKLTRVISFGDLGITSFNFAFMGAFNLIEVPANIPSSVTTTQQMFQDATSFNGDLSTWDVSNIHDMGFMFAGASFFNSNISNWNVSSVANMNGMFESTNFNQNIGNWNVSNVTSMDSMFENTISFNRDLSSWDVSKVNSMISMFSYDSLSAENYDKLLIGWSERSLQPNVIFDAGDSRYSLAGYDAREHLKNTFNWDITDGGLINPPLANYSYHINEFEASFTNESANAISYLWKFGDGTTSTDENPTHIYTNSGTYKVTLFAIYSTLQDSVSQIVDINCTTSFATDTHTACNSFTWIDGITYTESNSTAKYTLTNTGGCDSVVTLNLTINKSTTGTDVQSATDSFTWIDGITYTESNFTATHTLTNAAGCDSIVTLNLTLSPKPVILEFEVTNPNDKVIVLPIYGINLNIDWGDGIIEKRSVYSSVSHTYLNIGTYIVKINGNLESIGRDNFSFGDKLTKVLSFGNLGITSLRHAFINATRLAQVPDFLPSTVTEMYGMFKGATSFNGDISNWNVSNVTNMGFLFIDATSFNGDISNWNVSNVTNMYYMFQNASSFNRDISKWNVSNVSFMTNMFNGASSFNGDISNWDVSKVIDMNGMFQDASSFNGDISNWGVSNVTNMSNMFYNATSFNGDISNWDVSNVTNMQRMFSGASSFNRDISNWDVNKVTNMYYMFYNASSFNGDISRWNVSLVTNMNAMFYNATSFNGNISKWNVIKVADMTNMFYGVKIPAENYTALLITWANLPVKTSVKFHAGSSKYAPEAVIARNKLTINKYWTITDGGQIAKPTAAFSFQKDGYEVSFTNNSSSNSTAYLWKFGDGTSSSDKNPTHIYTNPGTYKVILYAINVIVKDSLLQPIDIICTSTYASDTHSACNSYTWIDGITYTKNNNTAKYILTNVGGCDSVVTLNLTINKSTTGTDVKGAINSYTWIDGNTYTESNNTATHTLTSAAGCDSVVTLNLTIFKNPMVLEFDINSASTISLPLIGTNLTIYWGDGQIQKLTSVNGLVNHYYKSTGIYTVLLDGSLTTYGSNSFTYNPNAGKLTKVLSFGNLGITSLAYAFMSEMSLIKVPEHLPSTVINLLYTFHNARSFNGDINNWDVSNVTNMERAFGGATSFNGDISNWDVSKVTNMSNIFDCATSFNGDISNWDVSNVTDMFGMFGSATSFNGDISNWNVSKVTNMFGMFSNATSFNGDISSWNVSNVSNTQFMFSNATSFNGDISNWDVSKVTNMSQMFSGATSFNGDISKWNVSIVTFMNSMFKGAISFNGNISNWNVSKVTNMTDMFLGVDIPTENYTALLINWAKLLVKSNVTFNGGLSKYTSEAVAARNKLDNDYYWTITDGGELLIPTATYSFQQNGNEVSFTNESTNGTSYLWSFDDGTTSTEINPTHTYANPGTYIVTLYAINDILKDSLKQTFEIICVSNSGTDVQTACDSFTWMDGITYTENNNTAKYTLTNIAGCDSIVTLNLTLLKQPVIEVQPFPSINSCENDPDIKLYIDAADKDVTYQWYFNGEALLNETDSVLTLATEFSNEGTYFCQVSNTCNNKVSNNSVVTINHSTSSTDVITACDSYTWIDGNTYTESNNTATFALTSATGCDSIVTLDLTIHNSISGTDVITACDSYPWIDGNTYTESNNTATFALTNAAGCDSIVTLDLTINNSISGTDVITACDSYIWIDGNTYTESNNTATFTLTSATGCDSIVTLDLTINNNISGIDVITACDSYTWIDGNTYTESNNTATFALTNATGCDSIVTLDLTINHSVDGTDVITACDSYTWIDGNTYTESNNTATFALTNAAGCDSIVTLDLTINKSISGTDVITACDSFTWIDGNTYTESNKTATFALTSATGCDSLVTLNITINHSTSGTDVITACDSYTWIDGNTYTESNNTATFALTSGTGCDSIVTLNLTINHSIGSTDAITACDSYTWIDGNTYTESNNTATFALTSATGCDSIVTMNLTINHSTNGTDIITACESYTWIDGITYTSNNNTATFTLTNALGCDSIVNLDLTLVEGPMILEFNTTLSNQTEKGFTENKSTKSSETTIGIPLSEGNIIIDWGDGNMDTILEIPVPSIFTHTFANEGIYKVKITGKLDTYGGSTINDYAGKLTKVISFGNLGISSFDYAFANENKLIEVPAVIPESVKSMKQMFYGASLFKGDLSTWDVSRIIDMQDMFDGATSFDGDISNWIVSNVKTMDFIFRGTSLSTYRYDAILNKWSELPLQENVNLNNSNYFTSSSASARQKIITLYHWSITDKGLILNPTAAFTYTKDQKTVSFTNNSAHAINYQWDFGDGTRSTDEFPIHTFENVGNYIVSLIATNYDLKDTLNILIEVSCDVENVIDRQFACDSYTWIDGNTYTESNNTATFALTNAAGCDSIVTLDLTINHSTYGTDVITACDSYTWIDGNTYTESNNTATFALTSGTGCDSIVTLDLTINQSTSGTDVITACDSYTWIDGNTYTESNNTATFALTSATGCDSIVTLDLTINHSISGTDVITACDSYTWIDGNTYTESNNTATFALTNAAGCDSIVTLDLTINQSTSGTDVITACDSYTWIDGNTYTESNNTATFALTSGTGCDSIVTLDLTINHSIGSTDAITACDSYTWIDGNTYTESNNTATFALTNATGCDSIVTLNLTINQSYNEIIEITICNGETYSFGNQVLKFPGEYSEVFISVLGCDSLVSLNLKVTNVDTEVIQDGVTLTANATDAIYQWGTCGNVFLPIKGETSKSYRVTENGNYAVIIEQNSCVDTSICYAVTWYSILDDGFNNKIEIYPNPTNDYLNIDFKEIFELIEVFVINPMGKIIITEKSKKSDSIKLDFSTQPQGIYDILIKADGLKATYQIVNK